MKYLTKKDLKRMFISAYYKVRNNREHVNEINVFPIPDQDTGDNLTRTLKGVYDAARIDDYEDIEKMRERLLDGALASASGNIGIIMTGFINGFFLSLPNQKVAIKDIKMGLKEGAKQAYDSIQDPKKGTVLDVVQACVKIKGEAAKEEDIIAYLKHTLIAANIALAKTQQYMEIYKKVSTVDAGAYGFVLMLEGFIEGLENTKLEVEDGDKISGEDRAIFVQILENKFEVISLLESPNKSRDEIIALLTSWGNSIDIVEANKKLKIHIHTDYCNEVVDLISTLGDVLQMHTYDMTKGPEEFSKESNTIGLLTDEGASLPLNLVIEHDISVVPFRTSWEKIEKDPRFLNSSIYERLRAIRKKTEETGWPRTAQPPQKAYYHAFKDQLKKYNQILCLPISSKVSGAYNSAIQAKKMLSKAEQSRIFIVDLQTGGGGQGILVLEAKHLIDIGLSIEDIIKRLKRLAPRVKVDILTSDIIWIIEGGRVSRSKGRMLSFFKKLMLYPIFEVKNGKIGLKKFKFGRTPLSQSAYSELKKHICKGKIKLALSHADNIKEADNFKKMLKDVPHQFIYESELSPVLGIHAGPDTLVVSYIT